MRLFASIALYLAIIAGMALPENGRKPVIGISVAGKVDNDYAKSIQMAGGIPHILEFTEDSTEIASQIDKIDALVLTGGEDIGTNPARDGFEFALFRLSRERGIPILGICRGQQLINVALGGTLYQDIPTEHPSEINHRSRHDINIESGSVLAEVLGTTVLEVCSTHHQAIKDLGEGLRVSACAQDGIIEAVESYPEGQIIAVQFHPEADIVNGDTLKLHIFRHFSYLCSRLK